MQCRCESLDTSSSSIWKQVPAIGFAAFLLWACPTLAGDYSSDDLISITIRGEPLSEVLGRLGETSDYTFQMTPDDLTTGPGPFLEIGPNTPEDAFNRLAAAYGVCAVVDSAKIVGTQTLVKILSCEHAEKYRKLLIAQGRLEFSTVRLGMVTIDGDAEGCSGNGFRGAEVTEFYDTDLSAYQAGVRVGDVIVSFGGMPISGSRRLSEVAARVQFNTAVTVVVVRNCQQHTLIFQF